MTRILTRRYEHVSFRLTKNKKEYHDRRSQRYSDRGREMEVHVEELLRKAIGGNNKPLFKEVIRHNPHSLEDNNGLDFTVSMMKGDLLATKSFGITISLKSWQESRQKHPDIPQMHLPLSIKPDTIVSKIARLFEIEHPLRPAP